MPKNHMRHVSAVWPGVAIAIAALLMIGSVQWNGMRLIPGDIGDARLNNYFLENAHQFLFGTSRSLWHLDIFYPFPYVLGFSDNLLGSAPVYFLARLFESDPHTSFQYWFLAGYFFNHVAAYWTLKKLGFDFFPATVGALIFAFSLPTTSHALHAQLHYRAAIPLSVFAFLQFLDSPQPRHLAATTGWMVLQYFCGIYMGFFLTMLLVCLLVVRLLTSRAQPLQSARTFVSRFTEAILSSGSFRYWLATLAYGSALLVLLYPYITVSRIYGFERSWDDISQMLPRAQSYLYSGASLLWPGADSDWFASLPQKHEHQMFPGAVPLGLALAGVVFAWKKRDSRVLWLASAGLMMVLATLQVGDFSLWYYMHQLPLASAIRAVTRLDQVLLLPIAVCAAMALQGLVRCHRWGAALGWLVAIPLVVEMGWVATYANPKSEWTQREHRLAQTVNQQTLPDNAVLFFAQTSGPAFAAELDAMWVALKLGRPTMNGYSGNFPPGYSLDFGTDCAELHRRDVAYRDWIQVNMRYASVHRMQNPTIVPVGFADCRPPSERPNSRVGIE